LLKGFALVREGITVFHNHEPPVYNTIPRWKRENVVWSGSKLWIKGSSWWKRMILMVLD
jgi:hypothetical protein